MKEFMSYAKSLEILRSHIKSWQKVQKVAITEALDRFIAVDIVAKKNYPNNEISAMDGYAFKFDDNLKELKLLADLPAGKQKDTLVEKAQCIKTFTGSLMSDGTDTLIPVENVEVNGDTVIIKKPVSKGFAVRKIGESYKEGELLIKKGTRLTYAHIALLAELGYFHISVLVRPRVAILATGSEIRDLGESLQSEAEIYSSNHVAIAMMVKKMGAEALICEIVRDKAQLVQEAIIKALSSCDILITTGGVSMGDYDFVKTTLNESYKIIIDGASIKPGRHIKIATSGDKFIFALPGFPYSAMVMCVLYVRVLLNTWFYQKEPYIKAILDEDYKKKSPFLEFSACNLEYKDGKIYANLVGKKSGSSAITNNLTNNAALLVIPQDSEFLAKGSVVDILLMV